MRGELLIRGLGCLLPLLAQACVSTSTAGSESQRRPVRWVLVERRYGDLAEPPPSGDGRVNPDAVVLAFRPLYAEDLEWQVAIDPEEHCVQVLGWTPPGPARPGEIVTATVRVGKAKAAERYRLIATPSQPEVRILGESQAIVRGAQSAVFRFTSGTSGRAGIAVGVERVGGPEGSTPGPE
jgi:hypothetical protein